MSVYAKSPGPDHGWASFLPLGLVALVFNLGGGLTAAALPLYAQSLGANYRDLGLLGATHGLVFSALTVPLGRASDRFGRSALLLASALAVGLAAACYLVSTRVLGLVGGKIVEAVGAAAFWPALEARAAEEFGGRAGAAMGVGYGAYAAAFMVGSSAAGFLIEAAGLRTPFAASLGTAAATLGLLFFLAPARPGRGLPEGEAAPHQATGAGTADGFARLQRVLGYSTGFVYVFGLGTVLTFLPAYAADRGLAPRGVGLLLGAYWAARLTASLVAGRLSDRWGRRAVLVPAMLLSGGAAILVAAPLGPAPLFVGTVGLGLTAGACAPTCVGLIADHVRAADRGMAMGLFEGACGVSFIVSGFIGGQTAQTFGPGAPYLLVSGLALIWAPVLARRLTPLALARSA